MRHVTARLQRHKSCPPAADHSHHLNRPLSSRCDMASLKPTLSPLLRRLAHPSTRPFTSSSASRLQRPAAASTSSHHHQPTLAATRCPECRQPLLRLPSHQTQARWAARRPYATAGGAHRPQTLDPGPPPPRNVGAPKSSIAGGLAQDARSRREQQQAHEGRGSAADGAAPSQAQGPTAAGAPPPPQQQQQQSRLRRPRRAAMTLTPAAVAHLRALLDAPEPRLIRVGVRSKGCSGSAYHLEFVEAPGRFDELVEQDGVRVLIDGGALIKVIGSEMDWVEDKLSARFTFKNPNISELQMILTRSC
jgi:iron-sulfur cluster assembly accessory protein